MCLGRKHFQLKPFLKKASKLGNYPFQVQWKNSKKLHKSKLNNSNGHQTNINGQLVK